MKKATIHILLRRPRFEKERKCGEEATRKIPVLLGLRWNSIIAGQCTNSLRFNRILLTRWFFDLLQLCRRQTVFFTVVDPGNEPQRDELYDVKAPRVVLHRTNWKVYQNAVYWIDLESADILANEFQCYRKGGTLQNRRNHISKDSFIATSATEEYCQKCLAS